MNVMDACYMRNDPRETALTTWWTIETSTHNILILKNGRHWPIN